MTSIVPVYGDHWTFLDFIRQLDALLWTLIIIAAVWFFVWWQSYRGVQA